MSIDDKHPTHAYKTKCCSEHTHTVVSVHFYNLIVLPNGCEWRRLFGIFRGAITFFMVFLDDGVYCILNSTWASHIMESNWIYVLCISSLGYFPSLRWLNDKYFYWIILSYACLFDACWYRTQWHIKSFSWRHRLIA